MIISQSKKMLLCDFGVGKCNNLGFSKKTKIIVFKMKVYEFRKIARLLVLGFFFEISV